MQKNTAIIRTVDGKHIPVIIIDPYPAAVSDDANPLGKIVLVISEDGRFFRDGLEVTVS